MADDSIAPLLARALALTPDALPAGAASHGRRRLLDTLGCAVAGREAEGVAPVVALARARAGPAGDIGKATVWGHGFRTTLADAAMANATMARALDFCDVISPGWHPSSTDVPVALACGEAADASGTEVLAALAAGQDLAQRVNRAAQARGFFYRGHDSNILALLSGAVIASRLLGLTPGQARDAVGIAFQHGVGTFQSYQDKALAVRVAQGWTARAAVEAALLARGGMTGARGVLDGECGFFRIHAPAEPDRALLLSEPDRWFGAEATCLKVYPSCGVTLALTDAALSVHAERGSAPVTMLRLSVSPTMRLICGQPYDPAGGPSAAIFSAGYVAANAILRGRATLAEFSAPAIAESPVALLASAAAITEDPGRTHFDDCAVEATLADGRVLRAAARHGRGWPSNPSSDEQVTAKFHANARHGGWKAAAACDLAAGVDAAEPVRSLVARMRDAPREALRRCVPEA